MPCWASAKHTDIGKTGRTSITSLKGPRDVTTSKPGKKRPHHWVLRDMLELGQRGGAPRPQGSLALLCRAPRDKAELSWLCQVRAGRALHSIPRLRVPVLSPQPYTELPLTGKPRPSTAAATNPRGTPAAQPAPRPSGRSSSPRAGGAKVPPPAGDGPVSLHNSCHPHRGAVHKCAGFPGDSEGEASSACNAGDLGLIPTSGRSPGEGNGTPLQYSCLENPMDGGAW